ncbi:MAG TPA: PIN domain-containing protein [Aquabacterium sp.]|jgi:predicted nucleic acid-binding protein|nr:PIN domain-containing protein [Aquabacterium sp.]
MAGSSQYTAVLDANTLYPAPLRDLLLSLAVDSLYHARWTARIHEEWVRNLARNRPELEVQLGALVELMNRSVPDCLVENYEGLIAGLVLPDPDDRHVLAAAIAGHADAIVTFNLKDFPADALDAHQIEAIHPDDFVLNQLELRPYEALAAVKKMRARLNRPPQTAAELIATLERSGLPASATHLRQAQALI